MEHGGLDLVDAEARAINPCNLILGLITHGTIEIVTGLATLPATHYPVPTLGTYRLPGFPKSGIPIPPRIGYRGLGVHGYSRELAPSSR